MQAGVNHRILMLSREATSETYGPWVYFPSHKFPIYFILQSLLSNLYHKNTKNIYLIISIRSHFCKWPWRDWQPLYRVGCKALIILCRYEATCVLPPTGLIPWFSKTEGNSYATLLHHPFLFKGKPTHAQEVARRISGAVAGEIYAKTTLPSTHHKLFSLALHYLPFASRFPLPHFTFAILFAPLPFDLLFACITMYLLFACIFSC